MSVAFDRSNPAVKHGVALAVDCAAMTPTTGLTQAEVTTNAVQGWLERPRNAGRLLGLGVAAGLVTRWAFAGALGLGFFVWTLFVVGAFAVAGGREAVQRARPAVAWAIAALFFSAMIVVRDSPELAAFNFSATVALLLLAAQDAAGGAHRTRLNDYAGALYSSTKGTAKNTIAMLREAALQANDAKARAPASGAVVRGLLIALPIVFVLGGLLASGDPRFSAAVGRVTENVPDLVVRVLDWGFVTLMGGSVVAGGWAFALRRRDAATSQEAESIKKLGLTEGAIVLGSVALLFAAFLAVQTGYLFHQDPSERGTGLTYARYAVDGFFELTLVAALTWLLVETAQRRIEAARPAQDATVRAVSSVVLAQALVILASAHVRLALYEEVYGFTVRRLFAHGIIAFLGLGLVARLVTLWVARAQCANLVVASGVAVLSAMNLLNPDAVVVNANLQRPTDVVAIDWNYFGTLSADAAPALAAASERAGQLDALERFGCRMTAPPTGLAQLNVARLVAQKLQLPCSE